MFALLAMFVVSKVGGAGGRRVGELDRVEARGPSGRPVARERLIVGEVVEGVVDRRGRVVDRLEAGVVETGGSNVLAVGEEDRAVLADLREDGWIVGVVGLARERARGELAEDVQGVAAPAVDRCPPR